MHERSEQQIINARQDRISQSSALRQRRALHAAGSSCRSRKQSSTTAAQVSTPGCSGYLTACSPSFSAALADVLPMQAIDIPCVASSPTICTHALQARGATSPGAMSRWVWGGGAATATDPGPGRRHLLASSPQHEQHPAPVHATLHAHTTTTANSAVPSTARMLRPAGPAGAGAGSLDGGGGAHGDDRRPPGGRQLALVQAGHRHRIVRVEAHHVKAARGQARLQQRRGGGRVLWRGQCVCVCVCVCVCCGCVHNMTCAGVVRGCAAPRAAQTGLQGSSCCLPAWMPGCLPCPPARLPCLHARTPAKGVPHL